MNGISIFYSVNYIRLLKLKCNGNISKEIYVYNTNFFFVNVKCHLLHEYTTKIVYILYTTSHCLMCIRSLTERVGAFDLDMKKYLSKPYKCGFHQDPGCVGTLFVGMSLKHCRTSVS